MTRPTLILGSEPRIAVPIARSLNKENVRVTVAAFAEGARKIASRAIHEFVVLPDPRGKPDQFLSTLVALIRKEQFDFLIPCDDSALLATSKFYDSLKDLVRVSCPPPQVVERVLDKRATLAAAESCGVPIPATVHISSLEELETVRNKLIFPMVCKPPSKQKENVYKVRYFLTYEDLRSSFTSGVTPGKEVLLQQYCEGEGVGVEVLIHKGEPVALFQHRRIREFPSTGGVSVVAVSEPLDADLVRLAVTLLRSLEWEGVAMVEFKYNRASRTVELMEVNGRYWGSLAVAMHAGVNFPLYDWQLAHGENPHVPADYRLGMRVRWMAGDLQRLHELLIDSGINKASRKSRWKELTDFMADFRPSTRDMVWSLADPLPAFLELSRVLRRLATDDFKRILRKVLPRRFAQHVRVYRQLGGLTGRTYLKLQALRAFGIRTGRLTRIPFGTSSVLFVCHGNIIRSPFAAALLKQHVSAMDGNPIRVSSVGTHAKPGRCADERARIAAKELGISLEDHRAQGLTSAQVAQADLIFVMDYLNEAQLLTLFPSARSKVFLLNNDMGKNQKGSDEIADPYDGDLAEVRQCYETVKSCISRLTLLLARPTSSR